MISVTSNGTFLLKNSLPLRWEAFDETKLRVLSRRDRTHVTYRYLGVSAVIKYSCGSSVPQSSSFYFKDSMSHWKMYLLGNTLFFHWVLAIIFPIESCCKCHIPLFCFDDGLPSSLAVNWLCSECFIFFIATLKSVRFSEKISARFSFLCSLVVI